MRLLGWCMIGAFAWMVAIGGMYAFWLLVAR
jgi:hypothetical protein